MTIDDGQQVVEVVRDAAGELANGFHLLGLAQLLVCLLGMHVVRSCPRALRHYGVQLPRRSSAGRIPRSR